MHCERARERIGATIYVRQTVQLDIRPDEQSNNFIIVDMININFLNCPPAQNLFNGQLRFRRIQEGTTNLICAPLCSCFEDTYMQQ